MLKQFFKQHGQAMVLWALLAPLLIQDRTKAKLLEEYPEKNWAEIMKMDSYYSYFLIPSLKRINYLYMNVDALKGTVNENPGIVFVENLFLTTKRASWID